MSKVIAGVRKLDDLGRIVIPREIIKAMDLKSGEDLRVALVDGEITVSRYEAGCHCCGKKAVITVFDLKLCDTCLNEFNNAREMINTLRGGR